MIIFLDIDGVMVPVKSWKRSELLDDGFFAFSSVATTVLQKIISDDTIIMLTTSHKSRYTVVQWKEIFHKRGIQVANLETLDENIEHLNRKDEILRWFSLNDINEDFIIIDDDSSLNDLSHYYKSRLILTSSMIGLTYNDLNKM